MPLQKRAKEETTRVTVLWTLLALSKQACGPEPNIDLAIQVIDSGPPPVSTEWWAARSLLEVERRGPETDNFIDHLIRRENEDGGWGWILGQRSDALATGMTLYAIDIVNAAEYEAQISRAVEWLLADQAADGSWAVRGTKKSTQKRVTPTAGYWGTA